MTTSPYRLHARAVIAEVLAGLDADVDEKTARKALRGLCRPSPRHMHQMYLKEVKLALDERYGPARRKEFDLTPLRVLALPAGVLCDWCKSDGCIACSQVRVERATFLAGDPERIVGWWNWFARLRETPEDGLTRLAFADWLEDGGWPEEAQRQRKVLA